ncbi:MAG: PhoD-like phosphatase N-terminal domain-containing protein [Acidimicrobiia bacterium]|nr:PhoD-like phosphatase N-terminal domain-containing protein [Acidimicrobiia bacterium]
MGGIGRRAFLGGTAATAAGLVAARLGALPSLAAPLGALPANPFTLGVASGDPLPTRVMLWTRLAPDPLNGGGVPPGDRPVDWEVATDPGFGDVVAAGTATAPTALAHSVHVDADRPGARLVVLVPVRGRRLDEPRGTDADPPGR